MPDGTSPAIPEDLARVAPENGFSLDMVRRAPAPGLRAGGEIPIPDDLAQLAAKHGWPETLLKRALALGAQPPMLIPQIEAGVRPDQAERFIVQQERVRAAGGSYEP